MITLYTWKTPNGRKPAIMLEELGWDYQAKGVDIGKDEQFAPGFLKVSPNNKIPAIVDDEADGGPLSIFESGAILTYLAERSGRLLAPSGHARFKALEWLYWQVGGLGPMLGQLGYFANRAPEQVPHAIERFKDECGRLIRVMNGRLSEADYLAGDYSIADIACYPWMVTATTMLQVPLASALEHAPAVQSWLDRVGERPAVQRGMAVLQH
ncbi:glutathione S-transferase family protein [Sphingomonas sp. MAH-20]|uniref:Glutathione S-transferase family protein n=1 Tax=Sphingomonas horti TaxID=2682842 RepID=A0A6I4IYK3_9SPHN|nr:MULTISPECIES: glutathione S-transferase N-terminal domain-containing protein [Sphingomonas]MBA2918187.1 glutathione S-transferase N-terminal domain-containing protein [Sphingomonas sp. CGMCC 1.13658]MVO77156.1 glutathione S-transferase family protein [Sphingomonas horti]